MSGWVHIILVIGFKGQERTGQMCKILYCVELKRFTLIIGQDDTFKKCPIPSNLPHQKPLQIALLSQNRNAPCRDQDLLRSFIVPSELPLELDSR